MKPIENSIFGSRHWKTKCPPSSILTLFYKVFYEGSFKITWRLEMFSTSGHQVRHSCHRHPSLPHWLLPATSTNDIPTTTIVLHHTSDPRNIFVDFCIDSRPFVFSAAITPTGDTCKKCSTNSIKKKSLKGRRTFCRLE